MLNAADPDSQQPEKWRTELRQACQKRGYDVQGEDDDTPDSVKVHYEKSQALLLKLLKDAPKGRILVLGPWLGKDMPLEWILGNFDHITMVDANIEPIKKVIDELSESKSHIKEKVTLIEDDLSGGFFRFVEENKPQVLESIKEDYKNFGRFKALLPGFMTILLAQGSQAAIASIADKQIKESTTTFVALLGDYLSLNLKKYDPKPDVIISSLVSSAVALEAMKLHGELFKSSGANVTIVDEDDSLLLMLFGIIAPHSLNAPVLQAYLNGIAQSGAKMIYFADTKVELLDKTVFKNFLQKFDKNYVRESKTNAWNYRDDFNVSWYTFISRDLIISSKNMAEPANKSCAICHKASKNICSRCKQVYYCDSGCQTKHWPTHKSVCRPPVSSENE